MILSLRFTSGAYTARCASLADATATVAYLRSEGATGRLLAVSCDGEPVDPGDVEECACMGCGCAPEHVAATGEVYCDRHSLALVLAFVPAKTAASSERAVSQ